MTASSALPKLQDLGVDWRGPGGFTPAERAAIEAWYSKFHGDGKLDGAPFVSFWLENDQEIFKRWRRMAEGSMRGGFGVASVPALLFLHTYAVLGWADGAAYEVIATLKWGISKKQVIDTLALAFIHGGPMGISLVGPRCDAQLKAWDGHVEQGVQAWPVRWEVDPQSFDAGLDFAAPGMSPREIDQLSQWHLEKQGEVPRYVSAMARWNPEVLKALRQRYENATRTLPKQVVPLLFCHTAAMQGKSDALRRSVFHARSNGVRRADIICTIMLAALYAGDFGMDQIVQIVEPFLEDWPTE